MALNQTHINVSAAGRRFFFGTNVIVAILLVAFVIIAINWLAHNRGIRRDLASGLTSHSLSPRTKTLVDQAKENLSITAVYTSDEPQSDRKKYLPKLQDYLTELTHYSNRVKVDYLHSGNERHALRNRIQQKYGSATAEFRETNELATTTWKQLEEACQGIMNQINTLYARNALLGRFPLAANLRATLDSDLKLIEKTRTELRDLTSGEGLPRYQEANTTIKETARTLKEHLERAQTWTGQMDALVRELGDIQQSEFVTETQRKILELTALGMRLQQIAGDMEDRTVPENPQEVMKDFANDARKLGNWLIEESNRVNNFVKQFPAIQYHPDWEIHEAIFVFKLPSILNQLANDATNLSEQLRGVLASNDVPLDQQQNVIRQLRQVAGQINERLKSWSQGIIKVLNEFNAIDQGSRDFLAVAGQLIKDPLEKIDQLTTKIDALPELTNLDEVSRRLQEENIVVVEGDAEVRVLTFGDVWPVADPMRGMSLTAQEEQRRIFDGDSVIGDAILSLQAEKPFATVILTAYETPPSPQMMQFGQTRKNTGRIPLEALSTLKDRLTKANFAVKEWNLGGEGEESERPEPEEGTRAVYVFLPPAETPRMNPFMRGQDMKSFGEPELAQVREALADNGRALFLCCYTFGQMPEYGYQSYLENEWGVQVDYTYRVLRGVIDSSNPNRYGVNLQRWAYLQLNNFTDHPIGSPFKARRMFLLETCPVHPSPQKPEGIKIEPILIVPNQPDIWAENNIEPILRAVLSGEQNSTFTRGPTAITPPFPVIMAVEKTGQAGSETIAEPENEQEPPPPSETTASRAVVMGNGLSIIDGYVDRRIMVSRGQEQVLVSEPAPTENIDLVVNALYWLADRPELIAAGPIDIPLVPTVEPQSYTRLWILCVGWAGVVLVFGIVMMVIRAR
ncbi:MAG: hypothetical protein GXY44_01480 [Phycisphaerales bacterium]|nr:hypothetical protein [Phycisphaerales bacterium]